MEGFPEPLSPSSIGLSLRDIEANVLLARWPIKLIPRAIGRCSEELVI